VIGGAMKQIGLFGAMRWESSAVDYRPVNQAV
jgi:aspartate/glutamate racemase